MPALLKSSDYTIPRTIRELQLIAFDLVHKHDYTIPRTIRELQHRQRKRVATVHYTIPRTIRELQHHRVAVRIPNIIPYQEQLGNYNYLDNDTIPHFIIPYQEQLGNYNLCAAFQF